MTSDDDTTAGSPPNPFNFIYGTRGAAILPAAARSPESRGCMAMGLPSFIVFTSNRTDRTAFKCQTADCTTPKKRSFLEKTVRKRDIQIDCKSELQHAPFPSITQR